MNLIKLNLYDRDWRKILPQINKDCIYLIKERGWNGGICYHASKIHKAGWVDVYSTQDMLSKPHAWEYNVGTHSSSFESTSLTYFLSDNILEIYCIDDPDYFAEEAKKELMKDV